MAFDRCRYVGDFGSTSTHNFFGSTQCSLGEHDSATPHSYFGTPPSETFDIGDVESLPVPDISEGTIEHAPGKPVSEKSEWTEWAERVDDDLDEFCERLDKLESNRDKAEWFVIGVLSVVIVIQILFG